MTHGIIAMKVCVMLRHGGNIRKCRYIGRFTKSRFMLKTNMKKKQLYAIDHGDMPNLTTFLVRTHCVVVKHQWDHLHLLPYVDRNARWYHNALIPSNFQTNSPYKHRQRDHHIIRFLHLWQPYQSHPLSNSTPPATELPARYTKLVSNSETGE